jgi:hypothetical protein
VIGVDEEVQKKTYGQISGHSVWCFQRDSECIHIMEGNITYHVEEISDFTIRLELIVEYPTLGKCVEQRGQNRTRRLGAYNSGEVLCEYKFVSASQRDMNTGRRN